MSVQANGESLYAQVSPFPSPKREGGRAMVAGRFRKNVHAKVQTDHRFACLLAFRTP
jgi:hypothetical protein